MFEAGRDFEIDNLPIYENSLFVLGKSCDKHRTIDKLSFVLINNGEFVFDKRSVKSKTERFNLKEQFNKTLEDKNINIETDTWKMPNSKVLIGVSQKRYGKTLGKKTLDRDICDQDFNNLIKKLRVFSEEQQKVILVCAHFEQYTKDAVTLEDPHCHVLYNKFTKFEKNALGDFLINK